MKSSIRRRKLLRLRRNTKNRSRRREKHHGGFLDKLLHRNKASMRRGDRRLIRNITRRSSVGAGAAGAGVAAHDGRKPIAQNHLQAFSQHSIPLDWAAAYWY